MTREEAKKRLLGECKVVTHYSWNTDREASDISHSGISDSLSLKLIEEIYDDIENYLKAQAEDHRRDFRDRCVFREVLEHIGGTA